MGKHTDHQPVTVIYLDVALAPYATLRDVLDLVPREHVERVQTNPSDDPSRVKVVLHDDATPHTVAELRAALAPLVLTDPALKRGNIGTVFLPASPTLA